MMTCSLLQKLHIKFLCKRASGTPPSSLNHGQHPLTPSWHGMALSQVIDGDKVYSAELRTSTKTFSTPSA